MTEFQITVFRSAQELFALRGFDGASISEIAVKAGIAKSTVLHHFPSKLRLYQKVMKHSIDQFTEILESAPAGDDAETQITATFRKLLRWMIAEPIHAKLLNRIFLDNPQSAPVAAKKYWLPLMAQLAAIFPADFSMAKAELRLFILFIINSIFQMALSIELQVLLLGERVARDELCGRYEILVEAVIHERLFSAPAAILP
jgi:AcrR family transcriptional regulator